ncbi:MAG: DUF882 domain-containing protein [Hyphomicrobiales bacterium]|nr:MAG: DUF882 domain-containing protein [Hyphomicrobiales bacterium]
MGLRAMAMAVGLALFLAQASIPAAAGPNERTLWLHHTHTGETGKFTYWRNGQYDRKIIDQMNVFLADWRTKSKAKMDPALFDLMWVVYQEVGGKQPYNIVSSYREPKTNAMLASKSSGVAENSQHMLGKAMDVFIPGVKLATLRAAAMRHQVGGVGYYPTSGSPFVHMDTGSVRAWPRMTRAQLKNVFPDGKTLHLPVDGTPLSKDGRAYAQAQWSKCKMVPCNGMSAPPAYVDSGEPQVMLASLDPKQRSVATIEVTAPVPMMRRPDAMAALALDPANNTFGTSPDNPFNNPSDALATVLPFSKTPALMVATRGALPLDGTTALGAIDETAPMPRALMTPRDGEILTAYAPEITPDAGAQRALDILIERETAAAALVAPGAGEPRIDTSDIRVASLGGNNGMDVVQNIFDMTWTAVTEANATSAIANTLVSASLERDSLVGLKPREFDLVAPEIDHVNETLVMPVAMTDMHFAELYEPEGYLDNAAELGPLANRVMLEPDNAPPPRYDIFVVRRPMLVASR